MLLWHTPTDCTAAPEQEPSCDKLGMEPSSSPSSIGEGSQSQGYSSLMLALKWIQLRGCAQQPHTQCPTQQLSRKPARCPKPTAQKQNLQCFSRLPQSLMEVGQSMILIPKSPLIDQAVTVVGTHCPVVSNNSSMSSPAGSGELPLCAPSWTQVHIFPFWGISSGLPQPFSHTVKLSITLCCTDKAW